MYKLERQFVTTAHREIRVLEDIWGGEIASNHAHDTKKSLQAIKNAALQVQARSVFRSAALCEDICVRLGEGGGRRLGQNLGSLKALIGQYANGLFEIDPEFESLLKGACPVKAVPTIDDAQKRRHSEHKQAAKTLSPLLKLVKQDSRKSALMSLMSTQESLAFDTVAAPKNAPNLDAIIRPITNLILSEARQNGKIVSVSYGADFEVLEEELAKNVQRFLQILCLNIVATSIEYTATQISITGQKDDKETRFNLTWIGRTFHETLEPNSHFSRAIDALLLRGGHIEFTANTLQAGDKDGLNMQMAVVTFPNKEQKIQAGAPRKLDNVTGG